MTEIKINVTVNGEVDVQKIAEQIRRQIENATKKEEPLKVGDYAKFIIKDSGAGGVEVGDVVKLIGRGNAFDFEFRRVSDDKFSLTNAVNLIRATDEEVAEAKRQQAEKELERKWASINRKPNEFKKGDIVRYIRDGEVGEVVGVKGNAVDVYTAEFDVCTEEFKYIEMIAPAEARFDR